MRRISPYALDSVYTCRTLLRVVGCLVLCGGATASSATARNPSEAHGECSILQALCRAFCLNLPLLTLRLLPGVLHRLGVRSLSPSTGGQLPVGNYGSSVWHLCRSPPERAEGRWLQ